MAIGAVALDYCNLNDFSAVDGLELQQGNGGTFYLQLVNFKKTTVPPPSGGPFRFYSQSQDVTYAIRYLPPAGSVVQIVFPRASTVAATPANQDVTSPMTLVDARDGSLYQFTLTAAQVDKITSGGAKLQITSAGVTSTYPLDNFVRRRSNAPGA